MTIERSLDHAYRDLALIKFVATLEKQSKNQKMLALMQLYEFTAPKRGQAKQRNVSNIVFF